MVAKPVLSVRHELNDRYVKREQNQIIRQTYPVPTRQRDNLRSSQVGTLRENSAANALQVLFTNSFKKGFQTGLRNETREPSMSQITPSSLLVLTEAPGL